MENWDRVNRWIMDLVANHNVVCISWGRFRHEILTEHRRDPVVHKTLLAMGMGWPSDYRMLYDSFVLPSASSILSPNTSSCIRALRFMRAGICFGYTYASQALCSDSRFAQWMDILSEEDGARKMELHLAKGAVQFHPVRQRWVLIGMEKEGV